MTIELLKRFRVDLVNYSMYLDRRIDECLSEDNELAADIYTEVNEVYIAQIEDIDFIIKQWYEEDILLSVSNPSQKN